MCQNSMGNDGNFDYSTFTANIGLATINTANPNLNGTGDMQSVLTAGGSGTIVKSITIKSAPPDPEILQPFSQEGIVRIFIQDTDGDIILYKEVPIPAVPAAPRVPLPVPIYATFETILVGDLKLNAGYQLMASTQFADTFNIIAEGLDYAYPETPPEMCCTLIQETANIGLGVVNIADPYDFTGSGSLVEVFQAGSGANGSTIKAITIKAQQSTHVGMLRFYVSPDGEDMYLMREIPVPQTEQSAFVPSFKQVIEMNFNLEAGYYIFASTQNGEGFAITVEGEDWSYPS